MEESVSNNVLQFSYNWKILNFKYLYCDFKRNILESKPLLSVIYSNTFPNQYDDFKFVLRLLPKFVEDQTVHLSVFLYLEKCKTDDLLKTKFKISIVDKDGRKFNTKEDSRLFGKEHCFGFDKFVPINQKFLQANKNLTLFCEVEVENNGGKYSTIWEFFNLMNFSEISSEFQTIDCKWTIDDFSDYLLNSSVDNKTISIESPKFSPPENEQIGFYIALVLDNSQEDLLQKLARETISRFNVPEYNILLLGETGAGKSTFINAFANYKKYNDFNLAKASNLVQLIPTKFSLPNPYTRDLITIYSGKEDENEQPNGGSSSTRAPVTYTFQLNDQTIRIIDTPGMGDTNGVHVDRENFDKILDHLQNYKELHAIVVLIKSNQTHRTAFFRYYITELFTFLHRNAFNNILFCFTFSRNSFYGPGEAFRTLSKFLQTELKDVSLKLEPNENCFFVDSNAYHFLVAEKKGYKLAKHEVGYKNSWDISAKQFDKMWDRITQIAPHNLERTISLNNARKFILEMAKLIVWLETVIQSNISQIENQKELLKNSSEDIEEMVKRLHHEVYDLKMESMEYPRTVCTAAKCTELIQLNGEVKINYKTVCHPCCRKPYKSSNTVGHPSLKDCSAMKGLFCSNCGCHWQKHMHLRVQFTKVKRPIIDNDKGVKTKVNTKEDAIKVIEDATMKMETLIKECKDEQYIITDICTKIAVFFINNSNITHNRFIDPYLDLLMDEELKKVNPLLGYSKSTYDSLQRMKDTHRESVKILEDAINSNQQERVQLKDILKYQDVLFGLKQTGAQFKQIIETGVIAKKKNIQEKFLDLRNVTHNNKNNDSEREKAGFWSQFRFW